MSGGGFYQAPHCPHCHQPMPAAHRGSDAFSMPQAGFATVITTVVEDPNAMTCHEHYRKLADCPSCLSRWQLRRTQCASYVEQRPVAFFQIPADASAVNPLGTVS